jgi:hypothetical protein
MMSIQSYKVDHSDGMTAYTQRMQASSQWSNDFGQLRVHLLLLYLCLACVSTNSQVCTYAR